MNPFGTDAETLLYAATQAPLPALAAQLRRIAANLQKRSGLATQPDLMTKEVSGTTRKHQREVTDAFGLDENGRLSTAPEAILQRADLMTLQDEFERWKVSGALINEFDWFQAGAKRGSGDDAKDAALAQVRKIIDDLEALAWHDYSGREVGLAIRAWLVKAMGEST